MPQVPQPIESENGRPLSKLPPVAMQCAWLTITRDDRQRQAELERALVVAACAGRPNGRRLVGVDARDDARRRRRNRARGRPRAPAPAFRPRTDARRRRRLPRPSGSRPPAAMPASGGVAAAAGQRARRSPSPTWPVQPAESLPSCHISALQATPSARRRAAPRRAPRAPRAVASSHRGDDDDAVLRRAAGRVVEGLGAHDAVGGGVDVGRLVDDAGDVAGADAERRRAARVGRAHVGLRAGRDDEVALRASARRSLPW